MTRRRIGAQDRPPNKAADHNRARLCERRGNRKHPNGRQRRQGRPLRVRAQAPCHGPHGLRHHGNVARIELDPSVAEEARRILREAEVSRRGEIRVGDFMTFDLPPGSYDLVLLNNNLHYFSLPERRALLQRIRERLAPSGVSTTE